MIVYGDPAYEESLGVLCESLRRHLRQAERGGEDERRRLLIEAGQLEQALSDWAQDEPPARRMAQITDLAAAAFLGHGEIEPVREALARLDPPEECRVRVKIPEGFAFYALYPEQYARSAERWLMAHEHCKPCPVMVAGIRSIGTTLSAVVAQVLVHAGWPVRRFTLRPEGHPYERHARLRGEDLRAAGYGLVVDEGPGQSGSSMAAVAQALNEAGLDASCIDFFPGHPGEPGIAARGDVLRWWSRVQRYVTETADLRWQGRSLPEVLAQRCSAASAVCEDLSAGRWRRAVYSSEEQWPAAFSPFERAKFRVVPELGLARLWKFEGLCGGAEAAAARLDTLARRGWTVPPLDCVQGFVARPWIEGSPMERRFCGREVLERLGRYVYEAAGEPLAPQVRQSAMRRLSSMLYWNTRESLGPGSAEQARRLAEDLPELEWPAYGDGRLGPVEWLCCRDGRLLKVDCGGHSLDHTAVGEQAVVWDLAGAIVEWDLDDGGVSQLLAAFVAAGGRPVPERLLVFYRLAYAAFRLGQCVLCAAMAGSAEAERLNRAGLFYRLQLRRLLACH